MDIELLFALVFGAFVNILVLTQLIKIYKNVPSVIGRFGLFVVLEIIGVFFMSKGNMFLAILMLVLLIIYVIGLAFRMKTDENTENKLDENMTDEEKEEERKKRYEESLKKLDDLIEKEKPKTKIVKCPNCDSLDVDFVKNDKKTFSVGKAAAGTLLTGGVGSLAGFAGKKGDDIWHCKECGNIFEIKKK